MYIVINESCKFGKLGTCEISIAVNDELIVHGVEEHGKVECLAIYEDIITVKFFV